MMRQPRDGVKPKELSETAFADQHKPASIAVPRRFLTRLRTLVIKIKTINKDFIISHSDPSISCRYDGV